MNTPGPSRGWSDRRAKAARRRAEADAEASEKRAIRQALYAEHERSNAAAAAEAVEREKMARCSCPVCDGGGPISIELAARVITALHRLPAHVATDQGVIAALEAVLNGRDVSRSSVHADATGLHVPRKVYASAPAGDRAAVVTPKPETGKPTKPSRRLTAAEQHAVADGSILDLDD